jgi:hypothetical protein
VKGRRAILAGAAAIAAIAAGAFLLAPSPPRPLAALVPDDVLFYLEFPDGRAPAWLAERFPEAREGLERWRSWESRIAGPAAIYVDREREWVFLARLAGTAALLADVEVDGGVAVVGQSEAARARRRARRGNLADREEFRRLGRPGFLDLHALRPRGRLRDFGAVGFEIGPDGSMRGRALYRGSLLRLYLERYVRAPGRGFPRGGGPAAAAFTEAFARLWDDLLLALPRVDRERLEAEARSLARDFLGRRSFREFLDRVGPSWGFMIVPTPQGFPAAVAWVELPDAEARETLGRMLHRFAQDLRAHARRSGEAPLYDLEVQGSVWRLKFPWAAGLRLGEAFTPAYRFEKDRLVVSTCAAALEAPGAEPGEAHAALAIEVPAALELARALAPLAADAAVAAEADRRAEELFRRALPPAALAALRRQFPEASDRERFLMEERARCRARALEDLSRTEEWRQARERFLAGLDAWAARLAGLARVEAAGRFTPEGFDFEIVFRGR